MTPAWCRGSGIWQFVGGQGQQRHHSPFAKEKPAPLAYAAPRWRRRRGLHRRQLHHQPFRFDNRLELASRPAPSATQVGFIDEAGNPIPGFSVDARLSTATHQRPVEWLKSGTDVGSSPARLCTVVFRAGRHPSCAVRTGESMSTRHATLWPAATRRFAAAAGAPDHATRPFPSAIRPSATSPPPAPTSRATAASPSPGRPSPKR